MDDDTGAEGSSYANALKRPRKEPDEHTLFVWKDVSRPEWGKGEWAKVYAKVQVALLLKEQQDSSFRHPAVLEYHVRTGLFGGAQVHCEEAESCETMYELLRRYSYVEKKSEVDDRRHQFELEREERRRARMVTKISVKIPHSLSPKGCDMDAQSPFAAVNIIGSIAARNSWPIGWEILEIKEMGSPVDRLVYIKVTKEWIEALCSINKRPGTVFTGGERLSVRDQKGRSLKTSIPEFLPSTTATTTTTNTTTTPAIPAAPNPQPSGSPV